MIRGESERAANKGEILYNTKELFSVHHVDKNKCNYCFPKGKKNEAVLQQWLLQQYRLQKTIIETQQKECKTSEHLMS